MQLEEGNAMPDHIHMLLSVPPKYSFAMTMGYLKGKSDGLVKSWKTPLSVIPAEAGIQLYQIVTACLDSGFHRSGDFLRDYQKCSLHP